MNKQVEEMKNILIKDGYGFEKVKKVEPTLKEFVVLSNELCKLETMKSISFFITFFSSCVMVVLMIIWMIYKIDLVVYLLSSIALIFLLFYFISSWFIKRIMRIEDDMKVKGWEISDVLIN